MILIILKGIFVVVSVLLVLVILLQSGKGGDVAAAFGGAGSQSAFGPRGPQKPLEKATAILAGTFMFLALLFSLPGFGVSTVVSGGAVTTPTPATAASPTASPAESASPATSPAASTNPTSTPGAKATASPAASPVKK